MVATLTGQTARPERNRKTVTQGPSYWWCCWPGSSSGSACSTFSQISETSAEVTPGILQTNTQVSFREDGQCY